jgi:intracellular septation protein
VPNEPDSPTPPDASGAASAQTATPLVKLLIELGPLLAFFTVNAIWGIYAATGAFMVAIVPSLWASRRIEGRFPPMALVTAVFVLVFGGLTLWLRDETFIKVKATIVYLLFAAILIVGLALRRPFLKLAFGPVFELDARGWRLLTVRWTLFFAGLALLNEILWRSLSTDAWVAFKTFGVLPVTLVFALLQVPLIQRHQVEE